MQTPVMIAVKKKKKVTDKKFTLQRKGTDEYFFVLTWCFSYLHNFFKTSWFGEYNIKIYHEANHIL